MVVAAVRNKCGLIATPSVERVVSVITSPTESLGHRLSINPKPKRIACFLCHGEDRPIDFEVLVDGFANFILYGPLVGSLFLGLGGREQNPPRLTTLTMLRPSSSAAKFLRRIG